MTKRQAQNVARAIFGNGPFRLVELKPAQEGFESAWEVVAPMSNEGMSGCFTVISEGVIKNFYNSKYSWYNADVNQLSDADQFQWFETEPEREDGDEQ